MEVIIIGGGLIGLSIAFELIERGVKITIIEKDKIGKGASWAAGGMLAPQSEGLDGEFLNFCLESRNLYGDFIKRIEEKTLKETGYWKCGILKLAFSKEEAQKIKQDVERFKRLGLPALWLDRKALEKEYKNLGDEVIGGALYKEDSQVDNRTLCNALANYVKQNAKVLENTKVLKIDDKNGKFNKLITDKGEFKADLCVLSAGAWSGEILDIPVFPLKGEMLALDIQKDEIDKVLYSSKAYLIPRRDFHRLVVGATQENVGFKDGNTAYGTLKLLRGSINTLKNLAYKNIQELWFGYRPSTPDELPILGDSGIENLVLATGHHRNGILLAPITAKIISEYIVDDKRSKYLELFSLKRFKT